MNVSQMTDADVQKAEQIWAEYQTQHDVSNRKGRAAGVDPASGRIWLGDSIEDIARQLEGEGIEVPLYFVRVGYNYYYRKGGHR
jgi:hypothetical protein